MAKLMYAGALGTSRSISNLYIGNNNKARRIVKGYIGVANVSRVFYAFIYRWAKYSVNRELVNGNFYDVMNRTSTTTSSYTIRYGKYINWSTDGTPFVDESGLYGGRVTIQHSTGGGYLTGTTDKYFSIQSESYIPIYRARGKLSILWPENSNVISFYNVYDTKVSTSIGDYIETVESDQPAAYPTNGIHTDGYWYVRQ